MRGLRPLSRTLEPEPSQEDRSQIIRDILQQDDECLVWDLDLQYPLENDKAEDDDG